MERHTEVGISAPAAVVWAVLVDVERWPAWTRSVRTVQRLDLGPLEVGSRVRIAQPRIPTTVWTVSELDDGTGFTWVSTGPGVRTVAGHVITARGPESVTVRLSIDQYGWLGTPVAGLYGRLTERYLTLEAHGLKARAEAMPVPTTTAMPRSPVPEPGARHPSTGAYPGDFPGIPGMEYSPKPDGRPDPGEIVWTWVPYEEDHLKGKDRPVLLVGRDGPWLLALAMTSRDHDGDAAQEHRDGRDWVDIGSGPWDRRGRPSEIRVNRVVRVAEAAVRREGSVLPRALFDEVSEVVRARRG